MDYSKNFDKKEFVVCEKCGALIKREKAKVVLYVPGSASPSISFNEVARGELPKEYYCAKCAPPYDVRVESYKKMTYYKLKKIKLKKR